MTESTDLAGPYSEPSLKLLFQFIWGDKKTIFWQCRSRNLSNPCLSPLHLEVGQGHLISGQVISPASSVSRLLIESGLRIDWDRQELSTGPADRDCWVSVSHDLWGQLGRLSINSQTSNDIFIHFTMLFITLIYFHHILVRGHYVSVKMWTFMSVKDLVKTSFLSTSEITPLACFIFLTK